MRTQVTAAPSWPTEDAIIDGRYRVVSALGRGGAGSVYRVEDITSGQELALKLLAADVSTRIRALFEREYYTLSAIRHPNVVEVYEYGTVAGRAYYTMELLSGSDLARIAPVACGVALSYVRDAAKALAALHARRLVHRDISPRNLWLSQSGALKLLDFGALAEFGIPADVVGTPPFVAPESLAGQALDQRTDLYALGGLLYWLLTSQNAYPARALRELPKVWRERPVPPSARLRALGRDDLPTIPEEVDNLVQSLLSHELSARPGTAGELIDRITRITGGSSGANSRDAAELIVARPAFVVRQREQKHFMRQLTLAGLRRGGATLIEAEGGLGATRLLFELSLAARLEGFASVSVDSAHAAAWGNSLAALIGRLLDARPEAAVRAFAPYAVTLSALSPRLAKRMGVEEGVGQTAGVGLRAEVQDAAVAALVALSREAPLVLLVDDLQYVDDGTVGVLALLAEQAASEALLLLCAVSLQAGAIRSANLSALARAAEPLTLHPLSDAEMAALVRSIFSDVPLVSRLAERVQRATHGNPKHVTALLRQLVETDVVRQVDGTWVLPQELPEEPFVRTRVQAFEHRLTRLSADARRVARLFSIAPECFSAAAARALAEGEPGERAAVLSQLTREEVLRAGEDGYRFADESLRIRLRSELEKGEAARAHRALGRHLLAQPDASPVVRVDALVHMLEGGDTCEAPGALVSLTHQLTTTDTDRLSVIAPRLERALAIFRSQGRTGHALLTLLHVLATSGYFGDRALADRYAREAVTSLTRATGLSLATRLTPYVGKALALAIGLLVGALGFLRHRRDPCVVTFKQAIIYCVTTCTALIGIASICVAPAEAEAYARMLEPLEGFGKKHPLSLFAQFGRAAAGIASDRCGAVTSGLAHALLRLEEPRVVRLMSADSRIRYQGGALFALGVQACWREDPEALRIADRLEQTGMAVYAMSADQVRTLYHAIRGEFALYELHKHRAEMHAIKRGSAWQIETWMPSATTFAAYRSHDAMGLKHAIEQVERMEKRTPSLHILRNRAQAAYLLLRRRHVEALPLLERACSIEEAGVVGWARSNGMYARVLNTLGQHALALEVAERVFARMASADHYVWAMTLVLHIEHALARLGLGEHQVAREELEALLRRSEQSASPLTHANLLEALAQVTLAMGDISLSDSSFEAMARTYRATGIPSLAAHLQSLARARRHAQVGRGGETDNLELSLVGTTETQITSALHCAVDAALGQDDSGREVLLQRALHFLADQCNSQHGWMWLVDAAGVSLPASMSGPPPAELESWVHERLNSVADDDVTQTDHLESEDPSDPDRRAVGDELYQLFVLSCPQEGRELPLAAAIYARSPSSKFVPIELLRALAARLHRQIGARGQPLRSPRRSSHGCRSLPAKAEPIHTDSQPCDGDGTGDRS